MTAIPPEPTTPARDGGKKRPVPLISEDAEDVPTVNWPEPSELDSWWEAVMRPSSGGRPD